jgi:hypothetical protein
LRGLIGEAVRDGLLLRLRQIGMRRAGSTLGVRGITDNAERERNDARAEFLSHDLLLL